jgi:hypothetical protein
MRHLRPLCSSCVYWVAEHTAKPPSIGRCHRYPPGIYVNPQTGTVVQKFPSTEYHHWCGEWNADESRLVDAAKQIVEKGPPAP